MSQEPTTKDTKGKITLTWGDKSAVSVPRPSASVPVQTSRPQPAPIAEAKPQPVAETTPKAAPAPAAAPQPVHSPAARQEAATPAAAAAPAPEQKKKSGWASAFFDTLLVLVLMGALGGGAWYMHQQMQQYHVPTPLELAQAEHLELCKQHELLQNDAYKADEQLHMRQRITHLGIQLDDVKRKIADLKQNIENERGRIFSLQREIRQEDKTSRGVAKSMLIGLPIGNASTTNGRVYANAIIHRLESGRITLRTPQGQVRFPVSMLVKENLPDMVRYAFGLDDMVDMSDFEAAPGTPAPRKRRQGKLITPRKPSAQVTEPDYEPAPGTPVVESSAQPATITVEPGLTPEDDGTWQAPEGALPIAE